MNKPNTSGRFEYLLLVVCLCVLALRGMYTESTSFTTFSPEAVLGNDGFSVVISSILTVSMLVWCLVLFWRKQVRYRPSGVEVGAGLFIIAGLIGIVVASDKRAAITDMLTLAAPMLIAVMLIQMLDSSKKIKLVLSVLIALGVASCYQCAEQRLSSNEMLIQQYEKNPEAQLAQLGIEPGSFEHASYEHRLYSKDVRGFFTTGNSAGAFAIICLFAAIGRLTDKIRNRQTDGRNIMIYGTVILAITAGLLLTHSKGAIGAAAVAMAMFAVYLLFGQWLKRHRKAICILCVVAALLGTTAIVWYGLDHDTLPGGNSMLVRWQYWTGAVKMYADKPLTGVGGGNFASYYTHYKTPAAIETVKDPHNFLLSLLSQYGPIGLAGFVLAFLIPLLKPVFARGGTAPPNNNLQSRGNGLNKRFLAAGFIIALVLVTARPILIPLMQTVDTSEKMFVIVYLYLMPVFVFGIAFLLLWLGDSACEDNDQNAKPAPSMKAAFFCGVAGVAIANTIDFAIFEPGVLTAFWVMVACFAASDLNDGGGKTIVFAPGPKLRIAATAAVVVIATALFGAAVVPTTRASAITQRGLRGVENPRDLFNRAAAVDPLSGNVLNLNGRMHLEQYKSTGKKHAFLIGEAKRLYEEAARRNRVNFKSYDKLSEVYRLLAETANGRTRQEWIQKAYRTCLKAIERYPGSGRLRLNCAKLAEQLDKKAPAIEQYQKAIEIEDLYQEQFRVMYPGRDMVSRLGSDNYSFAQERLKELQK